MTLIEINENATEPNEYFKLLKSNTLKVDPKALEAALATIAEHILQAKKIGQKAFLRRLAFTGDVLLKEQILYQAGFKDYVLIEDIKRYIDKVKPANSVKIIELERYPRAIPWEAMQRIAKAQELKLFTDFCVVFTDFSDQDYKTPKDKEVVARNRDPIVFGFFKDDETGEKHHRFYMVADWEDETCDLTYPKLVDRMQSQGIKHPGKQISQDAAYIQGLIGQTLQETSKETGVKKKNFWSRFPWLK
jgi:hypothetical protein